MDPLTHSVFAIACAVAATRDRKLRRPAALAGFAGGLLPDADVLLRSATDPLFSLEYHRHFTHSLLFSPVIGLLAALIAGGLLRLFGRREIPRRWLFVAGWIAGLSHVFCDLWTSYGTRIYWPFAPTRAALDWISIIDPLLTVPVVACVALALRYASRRAAVTALCWISVYLIFCNVQRWRAGQALDGFLTGNGIRAERTSLKPSLGNVLVWRGMVQADGEFQALAIRCGIFSPVELIPGPVAPLFTEAEAVAWLGVPADSTQARDIARFTLFSDGWIGPREEPSEDLSGQADGSPTAADAPKILGDLRYASAPDEVAPLWGIALDPTRPDQHADYVTFREKTGPSLTRLWRMVRGDMRPDATEP